MIKNFLVIMASKDPNIIESSKDTAEYYQAKDCISLGQDFSKIIDTNQPINILIDGHASTEFYGDSIDEAITPASMADLLTNSGLDIAKNQTINIYLSGCAAFFMDSQFELNKSQTHLFAIKLAVELVKRGYKSNVRAFNNLGHSEEVSAQFVESYNQTAKVYAATSSAYEKYRELSHLFKELEQQYNEAKDLSKLISNQRQAKDETNRAKQSQVENKEIELFLYQRSTSFYEQELSRVEQQMSNSNLTIETESVAADKNNQQTYAMNFAESLTNYIQSLPAEFEQAQRNLVQINKHQSKIETLDTEIIALEQQSKHKLEIMQELDSNEKYLAELNQEKVKYEHILHTYDEQTSKTQIEATQNKITTLENTIANIQIIIKDLNKQLSSFQFDNYAEELQQKNNSRMLLSMRLNFYLEYSQYLDYFFEESKAKITAEINKTTIFTHNISHRVVAEQADLLPQQQKLELLQARKEFLSKQIKVLNNHAEDLNDDIFIIKLEINQIAEDISELQKAIDPLKETIVKLDQERKKIYEKQVSFLDLIYHTDDLVRTLTNVAGFCITMEDAQLLLDPNADLSKLNDKISIKSPKANQIAILDRLIDQLSANLDSHQLKNSYSPPHGLNVPNDQILVKLQNFRERIFAASANEIPTLLEIMKKELPQFTKEIKAMQKFSPKGDTDGNSDNDSNGERRVTKF